MKKMLFLNCSNTCMQVKLLDQLSAPQLSPADAQQIKIQAVCQHLVTLIEPHATNQRTGLRLGGIKLQHPHLITTTNGGAVVPGMDQLKQVIASRDASPTFPKHGAGPHQ